MVDHEPVSWRRLRGCRSIPGEERLMIGMLGSPA